MVKMAAFVLILDSDACLEPEFLHGKMVYYKLLPIYIAYNQEKRIIIMLIHIIYSLSLFTCYLLLLFRKREKKILFIWLFNFTRLMYVYCIHASITVFCIIQQHHTSLFINSIQYLVPFTIRQTAPIMITTTWTISIHLFLPACILLLQSSSCLLVSH